MVSYWIVLVGCVLLTHKLKALLSFQRPVIIYLFTWLDIPEHLHHSNIALRRLGLEAMTSYLRDSSVVMASGIWFSIGVMGCLRFWEENLANEIFCKLRVWKSVHHTFKWINQPDAAISQVYYLSFKYSSTCFGHEDARNTLSCSWDLLGRAS